MIQGVKKVCKLPNEFFIDELKNMKLTECKTKTTTEICMQTLTLHFMGDVPRGVVGKS